MMISLKEAAIYKNTVQEYLRENCRGCSNLTLGIGDVFYCSSRASQKCLTLREARATGKQELISHKYREANKAHQMDLFKDERGPRPCD